MPPTDPHAPNTPADPFAAAFLPNDAYEPFDHRGPGHPVEENDEVGPEPTGIVDVPPGLSDALSAPFLPTAALWQNRAAAACAAGAVALLGVWQFGLWEVELTDPPAGELADAAPGGPALGEPVTDPAALDWGEEWDPAAGLGEDAEGDAVADAAPAENAFDLLAAAPPTDAQAAEPDENLWGEEPAAPAPAPAVHADPLAAVTFDPPEAPAAVAGPAPAAAPGDFWTEPAPAVAAAPVAAADPFAVLGEPADPAPTPPTAADDPFAPAKNATPRPEPAVRVASASGAGTASAVVAADGVSAGDDPFYPTDEPAAAAASETAADPLAEIDAAIAAGEVLQAHTALSRLWWDDPAGRPGVRGRLDGTARQIYFDAASHFMTPRTVAAGETLADVAADLSVPPMYLARVNRVGPAAVAAGDTLKVIRGPFGAACDLDEGTLTVHAHGYYVRAFRCEAAGVPAGAYRVGGKAGSGAGVSLVLVPDAGGDPVRLSAAEPTAGAPGLGLSGSDVAQVFDLLTVGGAVVVRP